LAVRAPRQRGGQAMISTRLPAGSFTNARGAPQGKDSDTLITLHGEHQGFEGQTWSGG